MIDEILSDPPEDEEAGEDASAPKSPDGIG
jgi:hypothetical protein